MPTYQYRCPECKADIEDERRMDDPELPMYCFACGVFDGKLVRIRRVFSVAGVIFRGGGWAGKS